MRTKKLLLAAVFLVICFLVFLSKAKAQDLPSDLKIAYEKDDYVWAVNNKEKVKIGHGNYPALSDKVGAPSISAAQNEIAYILTKKKINTLTQRPTKKASIFIIFQAARQLI